MSLRQQLTGYVLHKRAYRETSVLVDFFTLEQGRVSAVAKGARGNSKSDRKSLLQALQKNEFELTGRSQLKNLGRIEGLGSNIRLHSNALYCAFYMNEILTRALPESESVPELFGDYESSLQQLALVTSQKLNEFEPILRSFEFNLLLSLGYLPDFTYAADSGEEISEQLSYTFDPLNGFNRSHPAVKGALQGKSILQVAAGNYQGDDSALVRHTAKIIARKALVEVIGDKPIKSRELFIAL